MHEREYGCRTVALGEERGRWENGSEEGCPHLDEPKKTQAASPIRAEERGALPNF